MQFLILNNGTSSFFENGVFTPTWIILIALLIIMVLALFTQMRFHNPLIGFEEDEDVEPSISPLSFTSWFLSVNEYEWQPFFIERYDLLTKSMNDYKHWCKTQNHLPNWDGGTEKFNPTIQ
ncbi:hypothetical protein ACOMCU_00770 [Lysinibacillus sp. UGB7]|uniref:hypothetical protein n=1 Tax=Lysinibacillus sp. UGB7 TaxID=3411039 RepID=UPI003B7FF416